MRLPDWTILVGVAAGCGDMQTPAESEAGKTPMLDPMPDAQLPDSPTPDAPAPDAAARALPVHVTARVEGAADLVLATATTIDTTALTINGATSPYFVSQPPYAVLFVRALEVTAPVTITGAAALIVVADDRIAVRGSLDLHAVGSAPGPGALTGGAGAGHSGILFKDSQRDILMSSGGGGGSYGRAGAEGGSRDATLAPPGLGGAVYGGSASDPLVGGSPGGNGGAASGAGGGGGALQLSAAGSIEIAAAINAGGGGGTGNGIGEGGGGGGGAGGEILLEAPSITMVRGGVLAANGGGGGGGGNLHSGGRPGGDGADGLASLARAAGGVSGIPMGGEGGAGAADVYNANVGEGNSFAGGGGGGVGRIILRYPASTPPALDFDFISPHATFDPTL